MSITTKLRAFGIWYCIVSGFDAQYPLRLLKTLDEHSRVLNFVLDEEHPWTEYVLRDIINRHLDGERDILMCQDELIEAGMVRYAKL